MHVLKVQTFIHASGQSRIVIANNFLYVFLFLNPKKKSSNFRIFFYKLCHFVFYSKKQNYEELTNLKKELIENVRKVQSGGDERAVAKHLKKGKLLARQRIDKLIDEFSPFLEFSPLAAHKCYEPETISSAGIVTGIGKICDTLCVIVANDATVKGKKIFKIYLSFKNKNVY